MEKLSPILARMGGPELGSRGHRLDHSATQGITNGKSYASLLGFRLKQVSTLERMGQRKHLGHRLRRRSPRAG